MEKIVRGASSLLFGLNYAGVVFGALTFIKEPEDKQTVFMKTCGINCLFLLNNYALSFMKFRAFPTHMAIQTVNDLGCTLVCVPVYAMFFWHN